ncbi:hypothetical protein WN71_009595 [Streptomyces mangrovisoli]|uniref:Uncharacterized protein n=2 Tax=Streptomyces mangrovisoli TaxID=1428628 RepID=A0A1J4P3K9_9ACTN|nr:hypothetical protein WN71_009595 [Streptomyces mangrovisoli]
MLGADRGPRTADRGPRTVDFEEGVMGAGRELPSGRRAMGVGAAEGGAVRFRPGDVVRLECPFTEASVTGVSRSHVSVRWPWNAVDPEAHSYAWNGDYALPLPSDQDWDRSYFRTEPAEATLRAGDACRVGIPPTVVHIASVYHFDPPLVTGLLPRPACYLELLPQGEAHDPELEDQGTTLDPAGEEPISIELVFRPYAFLEEGDEVVDRDGRAWRFDGPWDWHPYDGAEPASPTWPLTLLTRDGEPTPQAVAATDLATESGSHAAERDRWHRVALTPRTGGRR